MSAFIGLLLLVWSGVGEALLMPQPRPDPRSTVTDTSAQSSNGGWSSPCFVDDVVAALREAVDTEGVLLNSRFSLFGGCRSNSTSSLFSLSNLSAATKRNKGRELEVLRPAAVTVSEEQEGLSLTFDLPSSPTTTLRMLLVFEDALTEEEVNVIFSGHSLRPQAQSFCISDETRYVILTGESSDSGPDQKWRVMVESSSSDLKQNLKTSLATGIPGSAAHTPPVLLLTLRTQTDAGHPPPADSPRSSEQTSFLCELRRFLNAILPQDHTKLPLLHLDSLQSLPAVALGVSSSENLLAELINSSAPTIFSFNNWGTKFTERHGQLALSPALLAELRHRLEQSEALVMETIGVGRKSDVNVERLRRLKEFSALEQTGPREGERQYCAFLLLKALQTVVHAYNMKKQLRTTRAGQDEASQRPLCGLASLTVSFEKLFLGPQSANINNCHGSCTLPMRNGNNHAVLLASHAEKDASVRGPCCVPISYDSLEVVDFNEEASFLSIKPDMIVRECGCR